MTKLNNTAQSRLYTLVLFFFTLIASALILMVVHNQWRSDRTQEHDFLLNAQGKLLTADISRSLGSAEILASWVEINNGEIDGTKITYYSNGNTQSISPYVNGKIEGENKVFFNTGKLKSINV